MEFILNFLINIKKNKKKIYFFILIFIVFLIFLALVILPILDTDPFIYFQF